MLLGSEQFLKSDNDPVYSVCDVTSTDISDGDTDPIENVTVDELQPIDDGTRNQPIMRPPQNGLMSLLSGNQTTKRPPKRRKKKSPVDDEKKDTPKEASRSEAEVEASYVSDISDVPDTSFDVSEFERKAEKIQAIEDLEKRMFSSGKTVSVRDFLTKKKPPSSPNNINEPVDVITISEVNSSPEIIAIDDEEKPAVEDLELLFPASKSVNARNLFDSFGPKRTKKANGEWSLKVSLKISPDRLASVKKCENPSTDKGNSSSGESMLSALMRKKPSKKITLKVPGSVLEEISKSMNPLYTKSSGPREGKSSSSAFSMMMKSASQNAFPKLTAIQKLKGLLPPPIPRNAMHVLPEGDIFSEGMIRLPARRHTRPTVDIHEGSMSDFIPDPLPASSVSPPRLRYSGPSNYAQDELLKINAPLTLTSSPHKNVYSKFIQNGVPETKHLNWPQKFQPTEIDSLLIGQDSRKFLKEWMSNAFSVLETQSMKTPRNVKLKELQKKQRKRDASMLDFIVDDDEDDAEIREEEIFVPVLVIQGDHGSCKSASIYAAMAAMDGYVHEINTGQARSKKDIHSSLKEFCTTQIIHQNHDEKKFQKGLVLFEDCDILFEQDKTFWTTVQEVINFSRRPIVVTVEDITVIPKNILDIAEEQKSILNLEISSKEDVKQYLWLCAFSDNLNVSSEVLDDILRDCQTKKGIDLRKALMNCQFLCRTRSSAPGIWDISYVTDIKKDQPTRDLVSVAEKLDAVSLSDIIETNTHSSILHDVQINELLDIYVIDNSLHLRQQTLPHELNTGVSIGELIGREDVPTTQPSLMFNEIRIKVLDFISSRAKKLPKFIQELYGLRVQTRSRSTEGFVEERPETQGLPDTSVCYSMNPHALILDLAPMARYWASFQKGIIALDKQSMKNPTTRGLQEFLGWRKFYDYVDEVLATGPFSKEQ